MKNATVIVIAGLFALFAAACAPAAPEVPAAEGLQAPHFEVDPFWPQPLPNNWLVGSTVGIAVDDRDHVWVVHRGASIADSERGDCCTAAPPVLEFDPAGRLVGSWGGPGEGYDWPEAMHGIEVDAAGQVWLGGSGDSDSHVLVFTRTGEFVRQFGRPGARLDPASARRDPVNAADARLWVDGSHDHEHFGRVATIAVHGGEAYLADGYLNRRVAVIDAESGRVTRYWGAYGGAPEGGETAAAGAPVFRNVHCAKRAHDGLLYVCDRFNSRVQVFRTDGTFVVETVVADPAEQTGAAWDVAFSRDPDQTYLYLADGRSMKIRILRRDTLAPLTSIGAGGRQPGQFYGVHSLATDSHGNLYTTEAFEGKRVQKFTYRGLRAVSSQDQGVPWPRQP